MSARGSGPAEDRGEDRGTSEGTGIIPGRSRGCERAEPRTHRGTGARRMQRHPSDTEDPRGCVQGENRGFDAGCLRRNDALPQGRPAVVHNASDGPPSCLVDALPPPRALVSVSANGVSGSSGIAEFAGLSLRSVGLASIQQAHFSPRIALTNLISPLRSNPSNLIAAKQRSTNMATTIHFATPRVSNQFQPRDKYCQSSAGNDGVFSIAAIICTSESSSCAAYLSVNLIFPQSLTSPGCIVSRRPNSSAILYFSKMALTRSCKRKSSSLWDIKRLYNSSLCSSV